MYNIVQRMKVKLKEIHMDLGVTLSLIGKLHRVHVHSNFTVLFCSDTEDTLEKTQRYATIMTNYLHIIQLILQC